MMKRWLLGLIWANLLVCLGCSEKNEPKPLTYSQLLTGSEKKAWKMTVIEILDEDRTPIAGTPSDFLSSRRRCFADDLYVFYANEARLMEINQGSDKCSNTEDINVYLEDSWTLINSTATLEFPVFAFFGEYTVPFTLKELTASRMVVQYYFPDIDASYRFTFEAQSGG